ncbi:26S proteasome non-ATPase regulatory subunit 10 [Aspergillus lentulus]|uniref:26S proteasome non-ATPase regulatory subunit 10 n=1 Tax=Aspergillus lentulus TaxID=293939 RepID=A0ABQ1B2Y1_ASPLE|nr:26S proteasome non-ATPase regulatory subunit 10 [Aspergillus lentulus]GFF56485.1 26S proteasome non-ATPase regulatory subunit 10 [Aspergillus lentulus]GFF74835.1 26S proteasome non-ATPase regulatory subunit 10 [Aspergillus lentulus]GFF92685.1 26S proteasome non-ATPase regulatory subunit 10 [Aspergillus lentulus]GFF95948.1 26S proteasome non-ATPase regulatory subunit 10 [Aspergillus lentulus]GFG07635.1 26S proteasome non-ATPase regulatory subunit 10 [Aspergillus lentulus]
MPPNSANTAYINTFLVACGNGDLPKVQEALASGRLSAESLDTGLSRATQAAHLDIVAALFDAGVPMTSRAVGSLCGKEGHQDPRVIRLYFDRGLKPRKCTTSSGEPLLRFLNAACARELLERGVDPNRCGPTKTKPLASALNMAYKDNGAVFDLLVEYGAKVESSLFFSAICWSRSNTAFKTRFLLAKGLDPNTTSANWGTPLHCAVRFAMEDVVQILLDAGADPTARPGCKQFRDRSPAEVAELHIQVKHPSMQAKYQSILKLLVDAEHATNAVQANTEKPSAENATEPTAKRQKTNSKYTAVKNTPMGVISQDSISSRTRSRTKLSPN